MAADQRLPIEYLLPLRWADDSGLENLVTYLRWLIRQVDVTVVDGSPESILGNHIAAFPAGVRVIEPDRSLGVNGKVAAVLTAAPLCRHEWSIIADDDVRYSRPELERMAELLRGAEIVRPQNYFSPLPWHARWDTSRSLINRALSSDFPGTLGVRTSEIVAGYDGDVLFENLELIRTVIARGGREIKADGLYVRRLPPTPRAFFSQRVRQAYDSFAQPARLVAELAIVPLLLLTARRPGGAVAWLAVTIAVAEGGRRRAGGASVFDRHAALWAPIWVLERGICTWLALAARASGGVSYRGTRMLRAASDERGGFRGGRDG